jgi:uncharacterized protein
MSDPAPRQNLPHHVDALKLCQQRAQVSGAVSLTDLPRVAAQLHEVDGKAHAELVFDIDEQARRIIKGQIKASLQLVCQRCLEGIAVTVEPELSLALVWNDEQAGNLPRWLDPVLMEEPDLDLYVIVEDELLLALPLVAHHDTGACNPPVVSSEHISFEQPADDQSVEKKENPFQVLANLKTAVKKDANT